MSLFTLGIVNNFRTLLQLAKGTALPITNVIHRSRGHFVITDLQRKEAQARKGC